MSRRKRYRAFAFAIVYGAGLLAPDLPEPHTFPSGEKEINE